MEVVLISSLILGLGGSLHCIGMCGPLILQLPFAAYEGFQKWAAMALYFLSKALGYAMLGLLMALLGQGIRMFVWQQYLSVFAGVFILVLTLFPYFKNKLFQGFRLPAFFSRWYGKFVKDTGIFKFAVLGFLNALLPCGLVYTALIASVTMSDITGGVMYMFLFGIGTSFALIALAVFKDRISAAMRNRINKISTAIAILVGILLILRGLNLGIPYISPELEHGEVKSCCHKH